MNHRQSISAYCRQLQGHWLRACRSRAYRLGKKYYGSTDQSIGGSLVILHLQSKMLVCLDAEGFQRPLRSLLPTVAGMVKSD